MGLLTFDIKYIMFKKYFSYGLINPIVNINYIHPLLINVIEDLAVNKIPLCIFKVISNWFCLLYRLRGQLVQFVIVSNICSAAAHIYNWKHVAEKQRDN